MTTPAKKPPKRKIPQNRWSQFARDKAREARQRVEKARRERHRLVEQTTPDDVAAKIAAYRAEKAKRIEAGKPVLKSIDEWREVHAPRSEG